MSLLKLFLYYIGWQVAGVVLLAILGWVFLPRLLVATFPFIFSMPRKQKRKRLPYESEET